MLAPVNANVTVSQSFQKYTYIHMMLQTSSSGTNKLNCTRILITRARYHSHSYVALHKHEVEHHVTYIDLYP